DRRHLRIIEESGDRVSDVSQDEASPGTQQGPQEWLIHGEVARSPAIGKVTVVADRLGKPAGTLVEAIALDRDARVSLDGLCVVLEAKQTRTARDPELDGRERADPFSPCLPGREHKPEQGGRTFVD